MLSILLLLLISVASATPDPLSNCQCAARGALSDKTGCACRESCGKIGGTSGPKVCENVGGGGMECPDTLVCCCDEMKMPSECKDAPIDVSMLGDLCCAEGSEPDGFGACVATGCEEDSDCISGQQCNTASKKCECKYGGPVDNCCPEKCDKESEECDMDTGNCEECATNEDCTESNNSECREGICECEFGGDYPDCNECDSFRGCEDDEYCEEGMCVCKSPLQGPDRGGHCCAEGEVLEGDECVTPTEPECACEALGEGCGCRANCGGMMCNAGIPVGGGKLCAPTSVCCCPGDTGMCKEDIDSSQELLCGCETLSDCSLSGPASCDNGKCTCAFAGPDDAGVCCDEGEVLNNKGECACPDGFGGDKCECEDGFIYDHVSGKCVCRSGHIEWNGECIEDPCDINDGHGKCDMDTQICLSPGEDGCDKDSGCCRCKPGLKWDSNKKECVDPDACDETNCINGWCAWGKYCKCEPNWKGPTCEIYDDPCEKKCQNGDCKPSRPSWGNPRPSWGNQKPGRQLLTKSSWGNNKPKECVCDEGFEGEWCDRQKNPCEPNPCPTAYDPICKKDASEDGYRCEDKPGPCEMDKTLCGPNGMCIDDCRNDNHPDDYMCICLNGYKGQVPFKDCDISPCVGNSECGENGECVESATAADGFICDCDCPFNGDRCENQCQEDLECGLNAECVQNAIGMFMECKCKQNFNMGAGAGCGPSGCNCPDPCAGVDCQNGGTCENMDGMGECVCINGWRGTDCTTAPCDSDEAPECMNGGICIGAPAVCDCESGWGGDTCEEIEDACKLRTEEEACLNGGTCLSQGDPAVATCECEFPYSGEYCEKSPCDAPCVTEQEPCNDGPCGENGECEVDPSNNPGVLGCELGDNPTCGFECECDPGFSGNNNCDISPCDGDNKCENGGACVESDTTEVGFICKCDGPFFGVRCESANPCLLRDQDTCMNGGTCMPVVDDNDPDGATTCICELPYSGDYCETSPCEDVNCGNGECIVDTSQPGNFMCDCCEGYTFDAGADGELCQDIDNCEGDPCGAEGTCVDQVDGYSCECNPGFSGATCSEQFRPCDNDPCQNEGTCSETLTGYECECQHGFIGPDCGTAVDGLCCQLYGVFTDQKCSCRNAATCNRPGCAQSEDPIIDDRCPGPNNACCCDGPDGTCGLEEVDDGCPLPGGGCDPSPCLNGRCEEVSSGPLGYECICPEGEEFDDTQSPATCRPIEAGGVPIPGPCDVDNGGCERICTLSENGEDAVCSCPEGFTTEIGGACTASTEDPPNGGSTPCGSATSGCDDNASCDNVEGAETCVCNTGFTGDGSPGNCVVEPADNGQKPSKGWGTHGHGGSSSWSSSSDGSSSGSGGGGHKWGGKSQRSRGSRTSRQSAFANNDQFIDDNDNINDGGKTHGDMRYTLDISPWILYLSGGLILAFIALNYALCYYRAMSKENINHEKVIDTKISMSADDDEQSV